MSGNELLEYVEGIVHEETQAHENGLDLTAAGIHVIEEPGRVDFGGGELEAAETRSIEPERRNDEEYGWWDLPEGQYLLAFNESVRADAPVVLQTREAVRERGAFHPTLYVSEIERVPLSVPTGGIELKENARVSTVRRFDP